MATHPEILLAMKNLINIAGNGGNYEEINASLDVIPPDYIPLRARKIIDVEARIQSAMNNLSGNAIITAMERDELKSRMSSIIGI